MNEDNRPATKSDLTQLRSEFKGDLAQLRTEFKGDLIQFRTEFKGDLAELRAEFKGDMGQLKDELTEVIRDTETRLLKAFYTFAESNQTRIVEIERDAAGLKNRLALIETRLTEVEKRLNMPPQPQ